MAVEIKLTRYREHYSWSVQVSGDDADAAIAELERLDTQLQVRYGIGGTAARSS